MRSITSVNFFSAHNWLRLCGPLHLLHELFPQCECWLCRSCMWKLWIKRVWNSHWFWADNYSNHMMKTYTFTYCYDSFLLVYSYVFIIPYYYFFFFFTYCYFYLFTSTYVFYLFIFTFNSTFTYIIPFYTYCYSFLTVLLHIYHSLLIHCFLLLFICHFTVIANFYF